MSSLYNSMSYTRFQDWLVKEGKVDIFGFDKEIKVEKKDPKDDKPVKQINIESMMNYLARFPLGVKQPNIKFMNEIHWGEGPGSIRIWVGTGLNVMIERKGLDLQGVPRWITKKVFQLDQTGYGGFEEAIGEDLIKVLKEVDQKQLDYPKDNYDELDRLVGAMASAIRRTARDIFIFEGIKMLDENSYIIRLAVRGHGIEAQGHRRVEENQTHVHYDKKSGTIRVWNFNVESNVGGNHAWELMPTDTDWYFFPTQPREEIVETLANTLHWY